MNSPAYDPNALISEKENLRSSSPGVRPDQNNDDPVSRLPNYMLISKGADSQTEHC